MPGLSPHSSTHAARTDEERPLPQPRRHQLHETSREHRTRHARLYRRLAPHPTMRGHWRTFCECDTLTAHPRHQA